MKKTEKIDVYILNVVDPVTKGEKTCLKRKKVCLAYVPDVKRSAWCKEVVDESDGNVLVNCKYHAEKHKWEPISVSTSKRPSFASDFDVISLD
jgi:hypothetical protein